MKHTASKIILALWGCLLVVPALGAEEGPGILGQVAGDYDRGRYQEAAQAAALALADTSGLDRETITYLRTYRAFSLVALGQEGEAEAEFLRLLAANPKLELNPEFVSPKIIEVFRRARAKSGLRERSRERPIYQQLRPPKAQALWRSLLWPGWGQRYRGSRTKASVLQGGSIAALGAWGMIHWQTTRYRQEYLESTDPEEIASRYGAYNRWYRMRNFTVNCLAAIWLYNVVDVMMME